MIDSVKISKYYFVGLLVWIIVLLCRKNGIIISCINSHCTDLYSVPMFCYTIKIFVNMYIDNTWNPSLRFILSSALYLTLTFEVISPKISNIYTADIIDAMCYFIGGIMYYAILKLSAKRD